MVSSVSGDTVRAVALLPRPTSWSVQAASAFFLPTLFRTDKLVLGLVVRMLATEAT